MEMPAGLDSNLLDKELEIQLDCIRRNRDDPVVKLRYDDRMVVWTTQILPDRLNQIRQENSIEYVNRMIGLLGADIRRLAAACERQYVITGSRPRIKDLMTRYITEIKAYAAEIARIEAKNDDN